MSDPTPPTPGRRIVVWFSCGAASAVAAKLAIAKYGSSVEVVYCDLSRDEDADNPRFRRDVEAWIGQSVTVIHSDRYASVEDVFAHRHYMSGPAGAPCTVEMKKIPRFAYQRPDDVHVFGFTAEEGTRIAHFEANNPELHVSWVLRDAGMTKAQCFGRLELAGIALPKLYAAGFSNNNCLGCVKATSPKYWNLVRTYAPDVFARRAAQSRELGCRLTRVAGERIYLDELPADLDGPDEDIACGPECASQSAFDFGVSHV